MKNGFAEAVREQLASGKKSLREVARQARMDPSFLSKLLLGQRSPPADEKRLAALARALGMDEDRLCFLAGRIPHRLYALFQKPSFIEDIRRRQMPSAGSISHFPVKPETKRKPIVQLAAKGASLSPRRLSDTLPEDLL